MPIPVPVGSARFAKVGTLADLQLRGGTLRHEQRHAATRQQEEKAYASV